MAEAEVKNTENSTIEKVNLKEEVFGLPIRDDILHEAVVNYLANQRQGTHATKTKGKVRGGGKKPWKQKNTGRARAGSIRSPLWKGGGVVFGPQPRDYSYSLNKKQKRLALKTALSMKAQENQLIVVDDLNIPEPKTKHMVSLLKTLGIHDRSVLIVTKDKDDTICRSSRNIPAVHVQCSSDLNTYSVVVHEVLLMTKYALVSIQEAV